MYRIFFILYLLSTIAPMLLGEEVSSKLDTMIVDGKYIMGDQDSKADARQYALLDAKRKIIEATGTIIKSYSKVENYVLTQDEIESYSVGLIQTEILEEKMEPSGETMAIIVKVRGIVNPSEMKELLANVSEESNVKAELDGLHDEYAKLKAELDSLKLTPTTSAPSQNDMQSKASPKTAKRISDRSEGWKELARLELIMQLVTESNKKRPDLVKIKNQTRLIVQQYPAMSFAMGYLGIAYFKNRQFAPAIENLTLGLESKPTPGVRNEKSTLQSKYQKQSALFHFYLAQCYRQTGQRKLAIKHLKEAQRLNPERKHFR